jgi:N-carbamoyl-L-amino-acid hydrolase
MFDPGAKELMAAVDRRLCLAEEMFSELRTRTVDGAGVTRPSYGSGEQIGHDLMRTAAERIGLEVTTDEIGNLYATLPGSNRSAPRWLTGSHFDSVRCGGNFDGAAGAVASLAAVAVLKDLGVKSQRDVSAMAIRA